jgi:hypothetical protein
MEQMYVSKKQNTGQSPTVEKVIGQLCAYWIQSFDPKKQQLYYKVEFSLEDDKLSCTCPAWKYKMGGGIMCKHMMRLLEVLS